MACTTKLLPIRRESATADKQRRKMRSTSRTTTQSFYSAQRSSPAAKRRSSSSSSSSLPPTVVPSPLSSTSETATHQDSSRSAAGRGLDLVPSQLAVHDMAPKSTSLSLFAGLVDSSHPNSNALQAVPRARVTRVAGNSDIGGPSKASGSSSNSNNNRLSAAGNGGSDSFSRGTKRSLGGMHDRGCACEDCTETALALQQFYDRQQMLKQAGLNDDEIGLFAGGVANNDFDDDDEIEILDVSVQLDSSVSEKTPEAKKKTCEICMDDKTLDSFYQLTPCLHAFCRECLEKSILTGIDDRDVEKLKCLSGGCMQLIEHNDVAQILSDVNKFKEYDNLLARIEIRRMDDVEVCPNPACGMQCFDIRAEQPNKTVVACPHCELLFCLLCKAVAAETDCETHRCKLFNRVIVEALNKYENRATTKAERENLERQFGKPKLDNLIADRLSQRVVDGKKRCPQCRAPTDRESGCYHMTCRRCRTDWCWLCGAKVQYNGTHFTAGACVLFEIPPVLEGIHVADAVEPVQNFLDAAAPDVPVFGMNLSD